MKLCIPEKILSRHLVVLGKTGAGKSSKLRHLVEHLLSQGERVCIVDPKGDWWGLKKSADGKEAGLPLIAFGDFVNPKASDVPINAQSGKHIAELISSGNRPCIIGLRGWMPSAMVKFWVDFASALFNAQPGKLHLIIDEAHNFAPKGKILDPESGKCVHWTNRLMSEGRGLGLTIYISSQRPQKVHNDTLTCCETLIAARLTHAADREAIKAWIDGCGDKAKGAEVLNGLAQLKVPEAWVWSPEYGFGPQIVEFPIFETFDSFAPPQLQKKVSMDGWANINLDDVKAKLATVIEEAKANDPAELKRQIHDLKKQIAAPAPKEQVKEIPVLSNVELKRLENLIEEIQQMPASITEPVRFITEKVQLLQGEVDFFKQLLSRATVKTTKLLPTPQATASACIGKEVKQAGLLPGAPSALTGTQQKILDVIAMLDVRELIPNREMVARWLDLHPKGGRYGADLAYLRAENILDGLAINAPVKINPLPTGLDAIRSVVDGTQWNIINELKDGKEHTRESLAVALDLHPKGGRFGADLARLRTMGLLPERGTIKLTPAAYK